MSLHMIASLSSEERVQERAQLDKGGWKLQVLRPSLKLSRSIANPKGVGREHQTVGSKADMGPPPGSCMSTCPLGPVLQKQCFHPMEGSLVAMEMPPDFVSEETITPALVCRRTPCKRRRRGTMAELNRSALHGCV